MAALEPVSAVVGNEDFGPGSAATAAKNEADGEKVYRARVPWFSWKVAMGNIGKPVYPFRGMPMPKRDYLQDEDH
jgi:hypothetical protein|tara:strand:+ start:1725 stop:1949 length:225 start_codon:yes stop_codon:yes gene_type:complete